MNPDGPPLDSAVGPVNAGTTPAGTSSAPTASGSASTSASASSTPLEQTIFLLRPAVFRTDPLLLCDIHRTIADCHGLTNTERTILLGVLPNMPSKFRVQDSPVRRLLSLSPVELRLLASVFQDGLIAARNLGGRPITASNSVDDDDSFGSAGSKRSLERADVPLTTKRAKLTVVGPEPAMPPVMPPPPPPPPPLTPIMSLLLSLGISQALPSAVGFRHMTRRGTLAIDCLSRQQNTCPITGRTGDTFPLETAHLVPHAVAAIESIAVTPYWRLLSLCLGPPLTSHIYAIVGGSKSFLPTNGLTLDPVVHHLFDRGTVCLIPHVPDDSFNPKTTRYYDVEFLWRGTMAGLVSMTSQLPLLPDQQTDAEMENYNLMDVVRPISIGDHFRLFTRDPETLPLPHPLLLSLHCMLWEMIAGAVLGETTKAKQTRVPPSDPPSRGRRGKHLAQQGRNSASQEPGSSNSAGATPISTPPTGASCGHHYTQHRHIVGGSGGSSSGGSSGSSSSAESEALPLFRSEQDEYLDFKLRQIAAARRYHENHDSEDSESEEEEEVEDEFKFVSPEMVWEFNAFCSERDAAMRAEGICEMSENSGLC